MDTIKLKSVVMEDFCNYKKPSMFLITCFCDWKCCKECGKDVCQNLSLSNAVYKEYKDSSIYNAYISNPITRSVVIGGLEPLLQANEIYDLISYFRNNGCNDDFVIYTGYTEKEVSENPEWEKILHLGHIVVKYGRFVPNQKPHFDEVLGIELISDNQYGKEY